MIRVITGPPCAGKTTYMHEHATAGDVLVDFDAIAAALGGPAHQATGAIKSAALTARAAVIAELLAAPDAEAWIIHTRPSESDHARYAAAGAQVIHLNPGLDECLARAQAAGRPATTVAAIRTYYEKATPMKLKHALAVEIKSIEDGPKPELKVFTGYASTWTRTPDSYGEVVAKGAFADSLAEWAAKATPIPVLWNHDYWQAESFVGYVLEAIEDDHGLLVKGAIDTSNPRGAHTYRLLKTGVITKMSFGYDVLDSATIDLDGERVRELRKIALHEVSLVPYPANPDTSIEDVKTGPAAHAAFTPAEIAALKKLAAKASQSAPVEGEAGDNAPASAEAAVSGKAARAAEAVARATQTLTALTTEG